jgi:hypothetical protein
MPWKLWHGVSSVNSIMTRTYLGIDDPVHHLVRTITRRAQLYARPAAADRPQRIVYDVREEELPESYYTLGMLHSLGGMSLASLSQSRWRVRPEERIGIAQQVNFFDAVNLDKRCSRDLRLKPKKLGPFMLSAELLVFGTGMLRARNDDPEDPLQRFLWSHHGRLAPPGEVVYANVRALHRYSDQSMELGKESFDSTNLIYGDTLGELEQLWNRRADTIFLQSVAETLHDFRARAELAAYLRPPLNSSSVVGLHLKRQAIWKTPPANARALLRRVEYILDRTTVIKHPEIVYQWRNCRTEPDLGLGKRTGEWRFDRSGYDGWFDKDGGGMDDSGPTGTSH